MAEKKSKKKNRYVYLQSTKSSYKYVVMKNNFSAKEKLKFNKYDPILRKHVLFVESAVVRHSK